MEAPHRVVGGIIDNVIGGINGAGRGIVGAVQGAGKTVVYGLDKPFQSITGKRGPIMIVDKLGDGAVSAAENAAERGFFGTIQTAGHGISGALDEPIDAVTSGLGKFKMPGSKR